MGREHAEAPGVEAARPTLKPCRSRGEEGWHLVSASIWDYQHGDLSAAVTLRSDAEDDRPLPASHFFRTGCEMPEVERAALDEAAGRVLDVGAGAGAHALELQGRGLEVTAIEMGAQNVEVMKARGVRDARRADIFLPAPAGERWRTLLLLMNGTTLVGSPAGLTRLFAAATGWLEPGGSVLIDSTDLRQAGEPDHREDGRYVGEVQIQVTYGARRSGPFPVLYADPDLLADCAAAAGLRARVLMHGEDGAYLARVEAPS